MDFVMEHHNDRDGLPLVMVSGMFAGMWMWSRVKDKLNASTLIMMKDPLCEIVNNVDDLISKVVELLNVLQGPVNFIGNSLGSYIALAAAVHRPEKVNHVVMSGAAGFSKVQLSQINMRDKVVWNIAKTLGEVVFYDHNKMDNTVVQSVAALLENPSNKMSMMRLMRQANDVNAKALLRSADCAVSAIWGAEDIVTPLSTAIDTFNETGVNVATIRESGHSPMWETPNEFARLANTFIR